MTISHLSKSPGAGAAPVAGNVALETAAVTRLLVTEESWITAATSPRAFPDVMPS